MNHTNLISSGKTILFLFIASFAISPFSVQAADIGKNQWQITADKLTRYEDPRSLIAEGNVELIKTEIVQKEIQTEQRTQWNLLLEESTDEQKQESADEDVATESKTITHIKSDWMVYDMDLGTVKARGNIFIQIGTDRLYAEKGSIDLKRQTGTFHNAIILREEKEVHLEGKIIEKTGDLTYRIEDGWIITCKLEDNETPPWSFKAANAEVSIDGYAVLKHATFRIKDVPVLYSPYMIIPTKQTRQTGFLFPEFSMSDRDGVGLNFPLFLNISPSSDMTLYPYYMANRGFMAGMEFRYMLTQNDKGNFRANFLNDDLTDPSETEYYEDSNFTHTNKDRYWLRAKSDHDFGAWTSRLDLDVVSDRDYLLEFKSGLNGFNETNASFSKVFGRGVQNQTTDTRSNTFRILRSWEGMSVIGELLGINDIRANKTNPTPLWKLPSLTFTGRKPVSETTVDFSWDANYVNYWRENGVGGHRIDIYPKLSMPVPLSDYLETSIEAGIRNTSYLIEENGESNWTGNDSENRLIATLATEIGTTLVRDFSLESDDLSAWNHVFRPFMKYYYTPDVDQADLPKFDGTDSIGENNLIVYGFNNFFNVFGTSSTGEYQREYAYLKMQQGYDLRNSQSDEPFTPIELRLGMTPHEQFQFIVKSDVDVYGDDITLFGVETSYRNSRGDYISADYRNKKLENISSIKADAKVNFLTNMAAAYSIERSLEDNKTLDQNIALIYQPSCWAVELSSHYTPSSHKIMLLFTLANIGDDLGINIFKN